jgi:hypothetical protein
VRRRSRRRAAQSSVLQLLVGAHHSAAIGRTDRTRRETVRDDDVVVVGLRYRLGEYERELADNCARRGDTFTIRWSSYSTSGTLALGDIDVPC